MGLDSDEEDQERAKLAEEENEEVTYKREDVDIEGLPRLYSDKKKIKTDEKKGMYAF
jgi:hypothetical protein